MSTHYFIFPACFNQNQIANIDKVIKSINVISNQIHAAKRVYSLSFNYYLSHAIIDLESISVDWYTQNNVRNCFNLNMSVLKITYVYECMVVHIDKKSQDRASDLRLIINKLHGILDDSYAQYQLEKLNKG